jgi:hypothetical protein
LREKRGEKEERGKKERREESIWAAKPTNDLVCNIGSCCLLAG